MTVTDTKPATRPPDPGDLPIIYLPYVDGMLRPETLAVAHASEIPYCAWPLPREDRGAYARAFETWWETMQDLVVVEHDMIPPAGMLREMIECPEDWCSANYHVGNGRTTTGLGITRISWRVKARYPGAGYNAARDMRDRSRYTDWVSLNESVDRHLYRLGLRQHIHFPNPVHLHYDQVSDAAG